ncbi:Translation initiation factor IF-2 like [Actinidia chinensis var. chinensis]|uniref:Translation initiation factor IF-2 like n=1 Tax=Actinidia chinensis var. chinensis TaxID=1590841 RepID=A0A2R6PX61_ACTCC|nr:Translation initiation factor IF-2 like [Actinidia chinensis var. chinensis]
MEILQQWCKMRLSFRNATIIVCFFNLITVILLLQGFLSASSNRKFTTNNPNSVQLRYIKESEEIRRAMEPLELMRRVREIEHEAYIKPKSVEQKEAKQAAAVDLISRLSNFRSYSDSGNLKALEEWRKRKMERARQRELGKNGTATSQASNSM